jgi:cell division septation protein DedD
MVTSVAMVSARPVRHRGRRRLVPATILGLLLAASLITAPGVAAQSLEWHRNPGTGHWYAIVEGMTWAEGEAYAVSLGGHLATINDEAEDRWISATFREETLAGFNDLDKDGTWVWASGETATYTNWLPDNPGHGGGGRDTSDVLLLNFDESGAYGWLAMPSRFTVGSGLLIEVASPVAPPVEMGVVAQSLDWQRNLGTGHWYATVEGMTWADGEAYAIQLGGHLATINDRAEDVWISATFPGDTLIGFNDLAHEGNWVWASGEPVTYTNWLPGEPTDGPDIAQINFTDHRWAGWNDTHFLDLLVEVVSPVAPPAEMPTATPTARPTATPTTQPTPRPTAPPTATPTAPPPTASPAPSPAASPSPQVVPGGGGIGPGGGGSGGGGGGPGPLVPGITTHIPTPAGISTDASVIEANLLLTGLVVLALVIATELLNRSLGEVQGALSGPLAIVRRFQRALVRLDDATLQRLAHRHRRLADIARLGGIAAFYGLVFALLDPTWDPLTITGAWLVLVMAVAAGVVGLGGDIAAWAVGRRWGVVGDLEIRAGSLLAAIGSTLVSRVVALSPGIMIGSPEAIDIDPDRIDQRRLGIIGAVGVGTVLLIGFTAWALTLGTAALRGTNPSLDLALGGADAFLLLVFAFAVQNGFVQLLSVRQSAGLALRRTHGQVWGIALLVVTFAFWHTLVNPGGDVATALRTTNALAFLATAGVALVLSVAVWIGTTLARRRATVVVLPARAIVAAAESPALRDIDLQRTFKYGPRALAENLGIDTGRAKALRWRLGIDRDPACRHDFEFGKMKVARYSDRAIERMREAIASGANLDGVRRAYEAAGRP